MCSRVRVQMRVHMCVRVRVHVRVLTAWLRALCGGRQSLRTLLHWKVIFSLACLLATTFCAVGRVFQIVTTLAAQFVRNEGVYVNVIGTL